MNSEYNAVAAAIGGVNNEQAHSAEQSMAFLQRAWRRFEEDISALPKRDRQAVLFAFSEKMRGVLYLFHSRAQWISRERQRETIPIESERLDHLREHLGKQAELFDFYHRR